MAGNDTIIGREKPHHSTVVSSNDPNDVPIPGEFDENGDEITPNESVVASKLAAGSTKASGGDTEAGSNEIPTFDKNGFYEDPEKTPKFEHEHDSDQLAGEGLTPESVKKNASENAPPDEGSQPDDYAWDVINKNIIENADEVDYTESDDEWWDNLPHDSEASEEIEGIILGEDGYYHRVQDEADEGEGEAEVND